MPPCMQYENESLRASSGIYCLRGNKVIGVELVVTLCSIRMLRYGNIVSVLVNSFVVF